MLARKSNNYRGKRERDGEWFTENNFDVESHLLFLFIRYILHWCGITMFAS